MAFGDGVTQTGIFQRGLGNAPGGTLTSVSVTDGTSAVGETPNESCNWFT